MPYFIVVKEVTTTIITVCGLPTHMLLFYNNNYIFYINNINRLTRRYVLTLKR